jgi:hypothetical protein
MQLLRGALTVVLLALPVFNCAKSQESKLEEIALKAFLQKYDKDQGPSADALYSLALFDLNNDGNREVLVYLSGSPVWCGTGGCTLLILTPQGNSYSLVTDMSVTRPPISVLPTTTNGWRDLGVWVQGGGIVNGYDVVLKFNGKTYPENPTMPPSEKAERRQPAEILISDPPKNAKELYP